MSDPQITVGAPRHRRRGTEGNSAVLAKATGLECRADPAKRAAFVARACAREPDLPIFALHDALDRTYDLGHVSQAAFRPMRESVRRADP